MSSAESACAIQISLFKDQRLLFSRSISSQFVFVKLLSIDTLLNSSLLKNQPKINYNQKT